MQPVMYENPSSFTNTDGAVVILGKVPEISKNRLFIWKINIVETTTEETCS